MEQAKRSLSVRSKALITVQQHGAAEGGGPWSGWRFEQQSSPLVNRLEEITRAPAAGQQARLGQGRRRPDHRQGDPGCQWSRGCSSGSAARRSTRPSPDQSISHGAAYYAGNAAERREVRPVDPEQGCARPRLARFQQQSVCARHLGILIRDGLSGERVPHCLIPANTPAAVHYKQTFGTVVECQQRVHLHIVEERGRRSRSPAVQLGESRSSKICPGLPVQSSIDVTIRYDARARVHVSAVEPKSGERGPGVDHPPGENRRSSSAAAVPARRTRRRHRPGRLAASALSPQRARPPAGKPEAAPAAASSTSELPSSSNEAERLIPLCNQCGEPERRGGVWQRLRSGLTDRHAEEDDLPASQAGEIGSPGGPRRSAQGPDGADVRAQTAKRRRLVNRSPRPDRSDPCPQPPDSRRAGADRICKLRNLRSDDRA